MSITDELRSVAAKTECANGRCEKLYRGDLERIADRIDVEHKKACDDAWDNGYEADYLGIAKWLTEHPQAMEHHGWVRLPLDADGVPIHIGDVIAYKDNTKPKEVVALVPPSVVMVEDGPRYADMCRHYHAPTVEDVLREFTDAVLEWAGKSGTVAEVGTWSDVAAQYAAKLCLVGEDA